MVEKDDGCFVYFKKYHSNNDWEEKFGRNWKGGTYYISKMILQKTLPEGNQV